MSRDEQLDLEIAIVGMAGRFPGAPSVEAFWRLLRDGVEAIRDLSDDEIRAAGIDEATAADPRYVRRAADLEKIDLFDAALFGYTPREAELADPQFRIFLEDAWTALENAGHLGDRRDLRVGVFAGASGDTYLQHNIATNPAAARAVGDFQTALGNVRDYLATQVSYRLDLRGPSLVVQTACSTSLVAVHLACQSLLNHECDTALAGGVSIGVPQTTGYMYEDGGIESPDGRCRAFSADAAGCVKGNGSGVVVLRRLGDALRDGDTIRAVIKGSAVNNDGRVKVGFTAPGEEGQSGVISEALAAADVDPSSITYIEAHGTGTTLGDRVEVAALARALGGGAGARKGVCSLGSVKSNVGHLDAAAGVAGLIKTVLALEHGEIPPSLHCEQENPEIDFSRAGLRVVKALTPWKAGEGPRRAGVSSFGIGGTNAHVVLEEAPPRPAPSGARRRPELIVLSAASETALDAAGEALVKKLEEESSPDLADAAFTLQVGRKRLPWRRAIVARDSGEAIAALRSPTRSTAGRLDKRRGSEVAFLFPGQGSQHVGMARRVYDEETVYKENLDRCAGILRPVLGLDIREVIFASEDSVEARERLRETSLAQPALFAVEYALARLWISWGIRPSAMAGHSIGEYVAACLAEVISLEEALGLVAERGRLMGRMPAGAMLAAQMPESELERRCAALRGLSVAAINGPSSCVASGPASEIERLERGLSEAGVACRILHTSHAFHSSMMDPVMPEFESRVRSVHLRPPSIPFLSNVTGTWITGDQATDPAYWVSHLRRAVRFSDNISTLADDPARVLLEVGPGTALTSLARLQAPREATVLASLPHAGASGGGEATILETLGSLWCAGVELDWDAFHGEALPRRVPLPTYPFQRERHWIEPGAPADDRGGRPAKEPDLSAWFYLPGWKRSAARPSHEDEEGPWLVFDDGSEPASRIVEMARERGARVATVCAGTRLERQDEDRFSIDPRRGDQYEKLLRDLGSAGMMPRRIAHFWCADGRSTDPGSAQDLGFFSLLLLAQAIGQTSPDTSGLAVAVIAADLFDVTGEKVLCPERATLIGPCRVMPQEYAGLSCRLIDPGSADATTAARAILAELDTADGEPVIAWRGGHRWSPSYARLRLEAGEEAPRPFAAGGSFLLTGGAGPLELALAARLAEEGARHIAFLDCDDPDSPELETLRASGVEVVCHSAPVTDPDRLEPAVSEIRGRFGRLDAVFHTAGTIGGGMIQLKEREAAESVLSPRVNGARALAGILGESELLVAFSSAISATGLFGQVDYCGGSAFLDALAQAGRHSPGPRILTIDWATALWDRWQEASGPGADSLAEQLREMQQSIGITVEEGVEALWRALRLDAPQVLVTPQEIDEVISQAVASSVTEFLEGVGSGNGRVVDRNGHEPADLVTDTERRVAAVWSALLGVPSIGRNDSFFDLGGNSLLAIQLASHLRRDFDIDLTIASLFESPDLASLAAAVDHALEGRRSAEEVARLLDEIESLSEDEVRSELEKAGGASSAEATGA